MDSKIDQALNRAFKDRPTYFNSFSGRNNFFKVALPNGTAYAYIDAFRGEQMIELDLVTIVQESEKDPQIFINELTFFNRFKAERKQLSNIEVSFQSNPNQSDIALVQIKYHYRDSKSKHKLGMLAFDLQEVKRKEKLVLEEVTTKKPVVQAQWHPLFEDFLLILTTEGFEVIMLTPEGFYWTSSTSFKVIGLEEPIKDFRFWPHQKGIRQMTVIATGETGNIHLLLCLFKQQVISQLSLQEQQIVGSLSLYSLVHYHTIKSPLRMSCLGIETSCPPSSEFLLLFRKTVGSTAKGHQYSIVISVLSEEQAQFSQRTLITVKGIEDDPEFQIPQNCVYDGKFHFWCGDKLTRLNLEEQITKISNAPLNSLSRIRSQNVPSDILLQISTKNFKFLILSSTSIKILRQAETSHRYLFTTISVQTTNLELQEKNVAKRLKMIFKDLSTSLEKLKKEGEEEVGVELKSKIKELTDSGVEKQLEEVSRAMESVLNEGQQSIKRERNELEQLYYLARGYAQEFQSSRSKWKELSSLLSRIEKNSQTIDRLEAKARAQGDEEGKIDCLQEMCNYIKQRPLQIQEQHRDKYQYAFDSQLSLAKDIELRLKELQKKLDLPLEKP